MLQSIGEVRELEAAIAAVHPELTGGLESAGLRQARSVMRLRHVRPVFRLIEGGDIDLSFSLPRGAYATTLLGELAILVKGRPARETNRIA